MTLEKVIVNKMESYEETDRDVTVESPVKRPMHAQEKEESRASNNHAAQKDNTSERESEVSRTSPTRRT